MSANLQEPTVTITLTIPASALRAVFAAAALPPANDAAPPPPPALPPPATPAPAPSAPLPSTEYVDTKVAAELLGVTSKALEAWRIRGGGPPFKRMGRAVRYRVEDLHAWCSANVRSV